MENITNELRTVAIIGRANVGKSTLFNRLIGRKKAIVHNQAGVTRDRKEAKGKLFDLAFTLVDTAGLEETGALAEAMWKQTEQAIDEADVLLYVIDAIVGITPQDNKLADFLRKKNKPVLLLANKAEGNASKFGVLEGCSIGLGEPLAISAEHGLGMDGLYQELKKYVPAQPKEKTLSRRQQNKLKDKTTKDISSSKNPEKSGLEKEISEHETDFFDSDEYDLSEPKNNEKTEDDKLIKIAIVGRPNAGKSTLVNKLLGKNRMLTGPIAGITRDSISIPWSYRGRNVELVDTAGLRKAAKARESSLEMLATADTLRSVFLAQVVILVLNADGVLEKQDLTIASQVIREGRALIIAVNKWDTVTDKNQVMQDVYTRLETSLRQVRGIPVVTISALTGFGLDTLMKTVLKTYEKWNKRISTSPLNRWLEKAVERHPTPIATNGRHIPMRYITQVKSRPPSFVVFSSNPDKLPESYFRYLINGIRDNFDLDGVPIRLTVRKPKNPYADKAKSNKDK